MHLFSSVYSDNLNRIHWHKFPYTVKYKLESTFVYISLDCMQSIIVWQKKKQKPPLHTILMVGPGSSVVL